MARLTRKSFKRKRILLGLCMFLSIVLISTGFAAWVISTDANASTDGNVNVGTITEANMEFVLDLPSDLEINFEPKEGDEDGRVTAGADGKFEKLSFTIKGKVTNADYLKSVTVEFTVPKTVVDAANEKYIVLPEGFSENKTNDDGSITYSATIATTFDDSTSEATLTDFIVEFKWGEKFGGVNPGVYYDEIEAGKAVSDSDLTDTLAAFYKLVYGATDAATGTANGSAPEFTLKLKATAN